jgi:hypothetical protein
MKGKAALPIGFAAFGITLLALGWITGLGLTGMGIGCLLGGLVTLAWRTGRHYQCE